MIFWYFLSLQNVWLEVNARFVSTKEEVSRASLELLGGNPKSKPQRFVLCLWILNTIKGVRNSIANLEFLCEIHYLWVLHQVVVDHWVNMWLEEWDWIPKISARHFLWIARCYPAYLLIFLANGRLSNFGKPPNRIFRGGTEHCSALCGANSALFWFC